jgi:hypothetical protein
VHFTPRRLAAAGLTGRGSCTGGRAKEKVFALMGSRQDQGGQKSSGNDSISMRHLWVDTTNFITNIY